LVIIGSTADILDHQEEKIGRDEFELDCVGGGRIFHEAGKKHILVYGYSQVNLAFKFHRVTMSETLFFIGFWSCGPYDFRRFIEEEIH
jgi:hypothetical protein